MGAMQYIPLLLPLPPPQKKNECKNSTHTKRIMAKAARDSYRFKSNYRALKTKQSSFLISNQQY